MIHECIEANREKFVRYAKIATVIGWVLLIGSAVMALPTLFTFHSLSFFILRTIIPVCFGMLFLMIGQFLKCELGLEEQPGWFFRNGYIILRCYVAVFIGAMILQYAMLITSFVKNNGSLWYVFLTLLSSYLNIAKVLLLWGLAGVFKLMLEEIRKKDGMGQLNG